MARKGRLVFVFWYRGLALGSLGRPTPTPATFVELAALLLGEPVAGSMMLATGLVVGYVAGAKRFAG